MSKRDNLLKRAPECTEGTRHSWHPGASYGHRCEKCGCIKFVRNCRTLYAPRGGATR